MKRIAKIAIIAASSAAAVAVMIAAVGILHARSENGDKPIVEDLKRDVTDPAQYGEWYGLPAPTNLYTFPEEIPDGASGTEYRFTLDNNQFDSSGLLYLKCTYDDDTYQNEICRLSDIQGICVDEEHYKGTAYVALLTNHAAEYALLSEKNTIVYVCYTEGMFPKHPDEQYMRIKDKDDDFSFENLKDLEQNAINAAENSKWISVYSDLKQEDLKYWPKSWTY